MTVKIQSINLTRRILFTLILFGMLIGVSSDLNLRFSPFLTKGNLPTSFVVFIIFVLIVTATVVIEIWKSEWFQPLLRLRARLGWIRWLLAVLAAISVSSFFFLSKWSYVFNGTYERLFIYLTILAIMTWLASSSIKESYEWTALLASILLFGTIFTLVEALKDAVPFPFSLSWSEGNRLWDYSILYGSSRYINPTHKIIRAYTDEGRQSLWGLPFFLPNVSIQMVRMWGAAVFTIPYMIFGWFVFRKAGAKRWIWFYLGLWTFLFLNQGPIYTPLILAAILAAATWHWPLLAATLMVGLAGYYARFSRYTWVFAPAIWAGMVAMVTPYLKSSSTLLSMKQHWIRAITITTGGAMISYFGRFIVVKMSSSLPVSSSTTTAITLEGISSTLNRQPLLWNRLWPNATNSLGIVFSLLLAVGPMAALIIFFGVSGRWKINIWQVLALVGSLLVFLGVGFVVSVKIGGGSNLHNLDMFLIGMVFAAALAWEAGFGEWILSNLGQVWWLTLLVLAAVIYPASQGMLTAGPLGLASNSRADEVLKNIQTNVNRAKVKGEVLFIDQRQLLTFGNVKDVALVPEYEKKLLMDEAMADDNVYFSRFNHDIANQRFKLIISEPLWHRKRGETYNFGSENDAWVKWISEPVLCYYKPIETFTDIGVQLLVPKTDLSNLDASCPKP